MKYKLYYFTLLMLVSLFLWYAVIFVLEGEAAGYTGLAAFLLEIMAVVESKHKD